MLLVPLLGPAAIAGCHLAHYLLHLSALVKQLIGVLGGGPASLCSRPQVNKVVWGLANTRYHLVENTVSLWRHLLRPR